MSALNSVTGASSQSEKNSIGQLRSLLTKIDDTTDEINKMSIESELTICEHFDSLRQQVDIARETALDNIHNASNTLMTEIEAYERECLAGWTTVRSSNELIAKDVSKRVRAFLDEQLAFLQRVQASEFELIPRLNVVNKLSQELSDRQKELKAVMFGNKLASFIASPSISNMSLGQLTLTNIQLPFKSLDIISNEFQPIDIPASYDFLLPLEHGQRIVTFKRHKTEEYDDDAMLMSSFDRLGRLVGSDDLDDYFEQKDVAQCGSNHFALYYHPDSPKLCVYNSSLHRLRNVRCKYFSTICGNSKLVFGMWDSGDSYETDYDDDEEEEEEYSNLRIQAHHLDTLSKAFELRVPEKYVIEQVMADEQHLVTISQPYKEWSRQWCVSVFDVQAICKESDKAARKFFLAQRHVRLALEPMRMPSAFLFHDWLVLVLANELAWFDKEGTRSETRTEWDSNKFEDIYSSGSSLILTKHDGKVLFKR